jgi:small neutral amino acid transporter SnatA (MarC family)
MDTLIICLGGIILMLIGLMALNVDDSKEKKSVSTLISILGVFSTGIGFFFLISGLDKLL